MIDESQHWLHHFFLFLLLAAAIQAVSGGLAVFLGQGSGSPVLLAFGLDAFVGCSRELVLARALRRNGGIEVDLRRDGRLLTAVACAYWVVAAGAALLGLVHLWQGRRPDPSLAGVALAAASMLAIPVAGSYMKALAIELRSRSLKSAAIFTFGNSYLSMVLLISLLVNAGMERWWGEALGALVMAPFIFQKGIQILLEVRGEPVQE